MFLNQIKWTCEIYGICMCAFEFTVTFSQGAAKSV